MTQQILNTKDEKESYFNLPKNVYGTTGET